MSVLSQFAAGGIKSVQRGVITIGYGGLFATATLSPVVNTSKAFVNFLGQEITDSTDNRAQGYIQLVNSNTIQATRAGAATAPTTLSYEVVEFY